MNKFVLVTITLLVALSALPIISAHHTSYNTYAVYNGYTGTYYTPSPWSHNTYAFQPRFTGEVGRPEGFGLVRTQAPYPPRGQVNYYDNKYLVGHTSAWTPGRFYSGIDGYRLQQPRYRNYHQPRGSQLQLNTLKWNY